MIASANTLQFKKTNATNIPLWWIKLTHFEFWPVWVVYFPALFYYVFLAFKTRSLLYFTAANPGIELGGFFGESKINILNKIDKKYLPHSLFVNANMPLNKLLQDFKKQNLDFPIICKPNVGERGSNVEKIQNEEELILYHQTLGQDFIIQEFITYEIELGVLYYHYPKTGESAVSSVVAKEFLTVTGDGYATINQLLQHNYRARLQGNALVNRIKIDPNTILENNQKLLIEPIGNHCRGTTFINANYLINATLIKVMDDIAKKMDGFYYGRFDLKVKSIEDLYKGNNIKIMEVNGTTSEPAHIYDPNYKLLDAYKTIFQHMKIIADISLQNHKKGVSYAAFKLFFKTIKKHFFSSK